jgi:hypothetical protein
MASTAVLALAALSALVSAAADETVLCQPSVGNSATSDSRSQFSLGIGVQ